MKQGAIATYRLLAQNHRRAVLRTMLETRNLFVWITACAILTYFSFTLAILGWTFGGIALNLFGVGLPVALVNDYLVSILFSLFGLRFLFQKVSKFRPGAYLLLPINRHRLIHFFQMASSVSLHNYLPLVFFLPFWYRFILPSYTFAGAWCWLLTVVGCLAFLTYFNNYLRIIFSQRNWLFIVVLVLGWGVMGIDQAAGTYLINDISRILFDSALSGNWLAPLAILIVTFVSYLAAFKEMEKQFHFMTSDAEADRHMGSFAWLDQSSMRGRLLAMEIKLIWRNKRPRHYLGLSVLFSSAYILILLLNPSEYGGLFFGAVVALFASGGFLLNYGQLMFSWESAYFDGYLARNIPFQKIIRSKLHLLQASCLILFVVSMPIFLVARPDLLLLHVAFLIYNAGVTSLVILVLATNNRRRIDLSRSGGFFNYEGFSLFHWFWIIPTAAPPLIVLFFFRGHPLTAIAIISSTGLIAMLTSKVWIEFISQRLRVNKYAMATGFRRYDY